MVKNGVSELSNVSDTPGSITVRGGMADRPTETPDGQIKGENGSNAGTLRERDARECEKGVA